MRNTKENKPLWTYAISNLLILDDRSRVENIKYFEEEDGTEIVQINYTNGKEDEYYVTSSSFREIIKTIIDAVYFDSNIARRVR